MPFNELAPWEHPKERFPSSKKPDAVTIYSLFPNIDKYALGYETVFKTLKNIADQGAPSFPPYNILKDGDDYEISMAVAGYSRDQLDIELVERTLTVKTVGLAEPKEGKQVIHKGIAQRNFTSTFALGEHIEVKDAKLEDGMLTIYLTLELPEEKKPKTIEIN